jgi:hypothetical protein
MGGLDDSFGSQKEARANHLPFEVRGEGGVTCSEDSELSQVTGNMCGSVIRPLPPCTVPTDLLFARASGTWLDLLPSNRPAAQC